MHISVLMSLDSKSKKRMLDAFPDAEITFAFDSSIPYEQRQKFDERFTDDLIDSDIIIGQPPVNLLSRLRKLKLLQLSMAGTEPYSKPGILPENVILCNATGAFGKAISEHMLGCTLMLIKNLHLYRDNMNNHEWRDRGSVRSLTDMTVLCIGLGDIGSAYARLCKQMGAYVIGARRYGKTKPSFVDELVLADDIDSALSRADIVAMSLPNTPETVHFMDEHKFRIMKEKSYLLNVGRGNAIDPDALYDALVSGKLKGASIDVTEPEPLPPGHQLWNCENLLITPHVSGFYHLRETYDTIVDIIINNILLFNEGKKPLTVVDFATGYRETRA